MAKLVILTSLLVALLALAEATTTITIDKENTAGSPSRCQEQMQMQQMHHCKMYLSLKSPYEPVVNPMPRYFKQCCQELQNMDEQCRCMAIKIMVMQHQQGGEWEGEEMQGPMIQKAKYIPRKCGLGPRICRIEAMWF